MRFVRRPDVSRRQVVVIPVELGVEQRLPEAVDRSAPAELRQPRQQRDIVELFARRDEAAARDERGETHAVVQRQQRERQELLGRAHREEPRVVVEADARRPEAEPITETELFREPADAIVRRQDDVVEAIDPVPGEVERADEAAEVRRALVHRDVCPCLSQPIGGGQTQDAATDNRDGGPRHTTTASRSSLRRARRQ